MTSHSKLKKKQEEAQENRKRRIFIHSLTFIAVKIRKRTGGGGIE